MEILDYFTVRGRLVSMGIVVIAMLLGMQSFVMFSYDRLVSQTMQTYQKKLRQVDQAEKIQLHFRMQVQAWKDALLRGHDPENFAKYLRRFKDEQAIVSTTAKELYATVDEQPIKEQIMLFSKAHGVLDEKYMLALELYLSMNSPIAAFIADKSVYGVDSTPIKECDLVEKKLRESLASTVLDLQKNQESTKRFLLTGSLILIMLLAVGLKVIIRSILLSETKILMLSEAMEQIDDIVYITKTNGEIVYANTACKMHTGYDPKNLIGKTPRVFSSGSHSKHYFERLWSRILDGEVFKHTISNKKKDGSIFYEEKTISPVRDIDGNILGFVSSGKDITEMVAAKNQLEMQASQDPLTGICNRRKFDELALIEVTRSQRYLRPLSLAILDIDHFKKINDTFGHQKGDEVLKIVAEILQDRVRTTDIVARWGGEEFVVLCPETSLENFSIVTESIRSIIEQREFFDDLKVTISIGATQCRHEDTMKTFFKRADDALYEAKHGGRNRVVNG